ncbi:hypothetical protein [Deferrisoma camini]|uniref:hypothetical protein n=1 Tax=Deferrisoma camini TaxID=1035120 RepID=UPI00046C9E95|nr:hypothetical protein [Deferrisoma camini]
MKPEDVTLYSGGARGAEAAFGETAAKHGVAEVNFTFEGHHIQRTESTRSLSANELAKGDVSMVEVAKRLGRDYSTRPWMRQILQSIWHQVNNGYQVFVVGTIQNDGTVKGGTGWAAELAKMWNRPLHVFDQERGHWFTWRNDTWIEDEPVIAHKTVCGTGTRNLNDAGRKAIEDLFARSFAR